MTEPLPLYFAFGSNLSIARLEARIGSFGVMGRATIKGRELRFHKRGADGSGKADCFKVADEQREVRGMVYEITPKQKRVLDLIEGVGQGYREGCARARMEIPGGVRNSDVIFYEAQPEAIDATLVPFDWYREYVLQGARQHKLGADYIAAIETVPTQRDPEAARSHDNWRRLR